MVDAWYHDDWVEYGLALYHTVFKASATVDVCLVLRRVEVVLKFLPPLITKSAANSS